MSILIFNEIQLLVVRVQLVACVLRHVSRRGYLKATKIFNVQYITKPPVTQPHNIYKTRTH